MLQRLTFLLKNLNIEGNKLSLSEEDKKYILNEYLGNIYHISDKDYQRRIWIQGEGPECDDFDETVCYHSSMTDSIFEEYETYGISKIQLDLLKKFHEKFKKFWKQNDLPQLFIDTLEWTKITIMAKEVLHAFGYHKGKF
jgi:hypothetical protein